VQQIKKESEFNCNLYIFGIDTYAFTKQNNMAGLVVKTMILYICKDDSLLYFLKTNQYGETYIAKTLFLKYPSTLPSLKQLTIQNA